MCTFRVVFNAPPVPRRPLRIPAENTGQGPFCPWEAQRESTCWDQTDPLSPIIKNWRGSKNGSACHRFNEAAVAPIALKPTLGEPEQKFWQISASEIRNVTLYTWKS